MCLDSSSHPPPAPPAICGSLGQSVKCPVTPSCLRAGRASQPKTRQKSAPGLEPRPPVLSFVNGTAWGCPLCHPRPRTRAHPADLMIYGADCAISRFRLDIYVRKKVNDGGHLKMSSRTNSGRTKMEESSFAPFDRLGAPFARLERAFFSAIAPFANVRACAVSGRGHRNL